MLLKCLAVSFVLLKIILNVRLWKIRIFTKELDALFWLYLVHCFC